MKREQLKAEKRTITGKKVRRLRSEGITPANIYGKDFASLSIQLPIKDFKTIYDKVHETGLIDLIVGKDTHPVLIHNVQIHPLSREAIHVDFYKVNLKEKVKTSIPIVSIGQSKAEKEKAGALMQSLNEIEIEALPTEIPENIEVSIESLAQIDDHILVSDLKVPTGVEILTPLDTTIYRITALISQEAEKLEAEKAAEAAEAAAAAEESAEGEEKAEGTEEKEGEKDTNEDSKPEDKKGDTKETPKTKE